MFFEICDSKRDNFPHNFQHKDLFINLDHGWNTDYDKHNNKLFYKGYLDNYCLEDFLDEIAEQEEPLFTGNFCLIKCFDQGVTFKTDRFRSFPIYYNNKSLTNLYTLGDPIHTDSFVMITNDLKKIESKFDLFPKSNYKHLSLHDCVSRVDNIITEKFTNFVKFNKLPLKVFLSGGIDTTTLYSYVLKLNIPHVLVKCFHTDLDYFYLKNHHTLSNFWGYRQIHYWTEPSLLLSGAPGDEFTVRSPTTANLMLRYHDLSIDRILENHKDSLHYRYFLNYSTLFESQKDAKFQSLNHVIDECLNIILNDYQHWHLGQTICFTPLRDIEIFKSIASLNKDDLINQIFNSIVQKELIKKNAPDLLNCLSTNKNTGNFLENLVNIYTEQPQDNNL